MGESDLTPSAYRVLVYREMVAMCLDPKYNSKRSALTNTTLSHAMEVPDLEGLLDEWGKKDDRASKWVKARADATRDEIFDNTLREFTTAIKDKNFAFDKADIAALRTCLDLFFTSFDVEPEESRPAADDGNDGPSTAKRIKTEQKKNEPST